MKVYQKHFYGVWKLREELSGLAKISMRADETMTSCQRCGVTVKMAASGYRFWIDGRWVAKRPPCVEAP